MMRNSWKWEGTGDLDEGVGEATGPGAGVGAGIKAGTGVGAGVKVGSGVGAGARLDLYEGVCEATGPVGGRQVTGLDHLGHRHIESSAANPGKEWLTDQRRLWPSLKTIKIRVKFFADLIWGQMLLLIQRSIFLTYDGDWNCHQIGKKKKKFGFFT